MRRAPLFRHWPVGILALSLAGPLTASPTPLAAFLNARHALASPCAPTALLAAAQQDPTAFSGRTFELPATVCGLIGDGGQQTVLLAAEGGTTLAVHLPASLRGVPWIDSGTHLRALILVERTGNEQSLSNVRLLAAAPELDVAETDRRVTQEKAARAQAELAALARRGSSPSRSLPYRRDSASRMESDPGGHPAAALSNAALQVYGPYRDAVSRLNPRLSDSELDTITSSILFFSERERVDPRLTMAMIIAESGFDLTSTSQTGAMGLGQLMPETARGLGVTNAYDPVQNIGAAVHLLRGHLDQYGGKLSLTMAAYNAGPGAVHKYHGVPPFRETRRYVARVASLYRQLCGE